MISTTWRPGPWAIHIHTGGISAHVLLLGDHVPLHLSHLHLGVDTAENCQ